MACNIGIVIYVILQFMAFFFVLVGTPLSMFSEAVEESPNRGCYTLWGFKADCSRIRQDKKSDQMWKLCVGRRDRFRAAQVFVVISILVYGAAFVLGFLMLCFHLLLRWVCLGLNVAGVITLCIVWASMMVTFNKDEGPGCPAMKELTRLGAGFILLLVAWCLNIINIFVVLIRFEDQKVDASANPGVYTTGGEEEVK